MNTNHGNLILTRKPGQRLFVFATQEEMEPMIMFEFNRLNGNQAVLRIEAPLNFKILREEVYKRILNEGKVSEEYSNEKEDDHGNR